jgi:hypothetical protein
MSAVAEAVGVGLLPLAATTIVMMNQPSAGQRGQETTEDHDAYAPVEASPEIHQDDRSTLFLALDA